MCDREIVQLIVGVYRRLLATERDRDDRGMILDLMREAETWLDQQRQPTVPPHDRTYQ